MYWRHESPTQKLLACVDRAEAPNIILLVCFKIFAQTPDHPAEGSYVKVVKSLIRPLKGLIRPLRALRAPKGLIRPLRAL